MLAVSIRNTVRAASRYGLALAGLLAGVLTSAMVRADVDQARVTALKYLVQTQNGDGRWSSALGDLDVQATANALQALRRGGLQKSPNYAAGLSWLANADASSTDARVRKVVALSDAGLAETAQFQVDALYALRVSPATASWGGYDGHTITYLDTVLGLSALRAADFDFGSKLSGSVGSIMCTLLPGRLAPAVGQSAWPMVPAVAGQPASSVRPSLVVTALMVEELMALRSQIASFRCAGTDYVLQTIANEAATWLRQRQNTTDAGFGELRPNGTQGASSIFVSALVYRAFASLPSPPQPATTNLLNYLLAQQNADGSWRGDAFLTTQALLALAPAAGSQALDTDKDGVPDVVEQALGRNTLVADAAGALGAPTQADKGITMTSFAAQGVVGVPFSYLIESQAAPVGIVSGALPPGISLESATGALAGTPTRGGSWSFEFQREIAGEQQTVIGRIDIASATAAEPSDGDVPLPGWALLALAGALFGAIQRRARA